MFDFHRQFVRFAFAAICAICLSTSPLKAEDDLLFNLPVGSDVVKPGDTFTVNLFVANLSSPINGVQALITYDPSILTLVGIAETNLGLFAPAEGWVRVHFSDNAGDVIYAVAINGGSIITTHAVATFTFIAVNAGVTNISFNAGVDPFINKLTVAINNSTLFPTLTASGTITSSCDDGLFCNGVETFDGVFCQPGTDPCNDGVACTVDSCDAILNNCTNAPNDLFCDNTLFCDGQEFCDTLLDCQFGTDPCNDGVACTVDTCDDAIDTCTHQLDDLFCDNTLFCDGLEFCDVLLDCQSGTDPCDDSVTCTVDTCDDVLDTCTNAPDDLFCDNSLFCDGVEFCDVLLDCQSGTDPCDDGVTCTVDTCDDVLDTCTNTPDDLFCDNTLFCDGVEFCDVLLDCQSGADPCDDGVTCTVATCDDALDICTNTPDDNFCSNGIFCDGAEICDPVQDCLPGVDPCNDLVDCTIDSCNESLDTCTNTTDDAFCSNSIFCDGAEVCDAVQGCLASSDPCAPLLCDEINSLCFAPIHITNIEAFYAGRFLDAPDPGVFFLSSGSIAAVENTSNYIRGITGIRITFDNTVAFAATPDAAFSYEWTTGIGTTFEPVTAAATNITVIHDTTSGVSVVDLVLADNYARSRWLRVAIDSAQVLVDGVQLDGELFGNPMQFPSGEGAPGGNAIFYIGNMAGDVTGDLKVTLTDAGQTRLQLNPGLLVPITNVFDVDKDGKVQLTDAGLVRLAVNPGFTLPLITAP